ncbi:hypothetical protein [Streptomyces sp. NPDC004685]
MPVRRGACGHFLPATGTCRCTGTRPARWEADLWGQRLEASARITTIRLATNHL